jgi:hypothetical protein
MSSAGTPTSFPVGSTVKQVRDGHVDALGKAKRRAAGLVVRNRVS